MNDPISVCEDTGERAVNGECPIHHGDACLFDITQMRDYVNGAVGLRDKHAAKVVEMFKEAEGLRAEILKLREELKICRLVFGDMKGGALDTISGIDCEYGRIDAALAPKTEGRPKHPKPSPPPPQNLKSRRPGW